MPITTLLFDLDDTLLPEVPAAHAAFVATGELARARYGIDPEALAEAVRSGQVAGAGPQLTTARTNLDPKTRAASS